MCTSIVASIVPTATGAYPEGGECRGSKRRDQESTLRFRGGTKSARGKRAPTASDQKTSPHAILRIGQGERGATQVSFITITMLPTLGFSSLHSLARSHTLPWHLGLRRVANAIIVLPSVRLLPPEAKSSDPYGNSKHHRQSSSKTCQLCYRMHATEHQHPTKIVIC